MKTFDTSILAVETSTLVAGYRILNVLTRDPLQVLDASPCGDRKFLILIAGEEGRLKSALVALLGTDGFSAADIVDQELIPKMDRSVLESVFSLSPQRLEQALLFIETETVPACLSMVNICVREHGLKPIEFKIRRAGSCGAYAVLTGAAAASSVAAEECRTKLRHDLREGTVEVIDQPTPTLRSFFEFSG